MSLTKEEMFEKYGYMLNEGETFGEERVINRCKCTLCRRQIPVITEAHLNGELSIMRGKWCMAEIAVACRTLFDDKKARWMKKATRIVFKTHQPTGTFDGYIAALSRTYDEVLAKAKEMNN